MTKAVNQLEKEISERFPGVRFGRCNCRYIAGTTIPTQHAWPGADGKPCGNARDIYAPTGDPDPMRFLDDVHAFIKTYAADLSVRTLLWRVKDHFTHIHVDHWPKGYRTPPCMGGANQYQYNDGLVVTGDPGPANGIHDLPDRDPWTPEEETMLTKGDAGKAVADVQEALIRGGYNLGPWTPFDSSYPEGADGKYGDATVDAVKAFQTQADGLKVTGSVDGLTAAFLFDGGTSTHGHTVTFTIPAQKITTTTSTMTGG
jgi:hypothetical protein